MDRDTLASISLAQDRSQRTVKLFRESNIEIEPNIANMGSMMVDSCENVRVRVVVPKLSHITLLNCHQTSLDGNNCITGVEIIRCRGLNMAISSPIFQIDDSEEIRLNIPQQTAQNLKIVATNVVNLVVGLDDGAVHRMGNIGKEGAVISYEGNEFVATSRENHASSQGGYLVL